MDAKAINYEKGFSELKLLLVNYRGALRKLEKSRLHRDRSYWTRAVKHWEGLLDESLTAPEIVKPHIKQFIDEFKNNLHVLRKEVPGVIVEDIEYRFDAIVDRLIHDVVQVDNLKEENSKTIER